MRKINYASAALTAALLILPTASMATADSSACTHHFSGPQICIRLEGRNGWNGVTGIWENPPANVGKRSVTLYLNSQAHSTKQAARVGKTLGYHWSSFNTGTKTKVCVKFQGSARMACQNTKYVGDRAS
ncbi:hypothetical protein [Streptomyces sp. NPDC050560]|uniref:hypothetical protein n=1 Tax=Streptomyces sp. NPDC050560 TaxID=3365630 RepID=UPI00379A7B1F